MGQVITQFTMSLDGFIAGPDDEVWPLLGWYMRGDTEFAAATADRAFKVSRASADLLREEWAGIGAIVTGRRDFDVSQAWGGSSPMDVPCFIVTHTPPQEWLKEGSPFTFITEGVASAIAQAKQVAGDKHNGARRWSARLFLFARVIWVTHLRSPKYCSMMTRI